ncbi:hypothetical protein CTI12_AA217680 [Artemisia annua]|uniref:Uncharacterized protein n=1 Tax=Artemisia annua TaxID=35608 RepID=A0A2U1NQB1_ARTAN|nr:hypothetical protein CTI12_AA217680 [Artemisia annua]
MKNMYAMVFLLVVITCMSSTLCVSSNNDGDQEIFMVVDDQTTMHDAGIQISKANPVQIGKFLLEDGKILTLSRQSSPSRNCIYPDQPCGLLDWCCEGLRCDGAFDGRCHPDPFCSPQGGACALLTPCCFPYACDGNSHGSTCV